MVNIQSLLGTVMATKYLRWLAIFAAAIVFLLWRSYRAWRIYNAPDEAEDADVKSSIDPYDSIEPLEDFDWSTTEPIRIRPFKPKYHLTMALEQISLSDLVANDKTYLDRMKLRKSILDEHPRKTYRCNEPCSDAVFEVYEWFFGTYLPQRFPTMYKLVEYDQASNEKQPSSGRMLHNIAANEYIPLQVLSPEKALYTLGCHIDTDILILLPSSTAADGSPIYHLQAFVCCFPSGFKTQEKLGLPLAGIHKPVPGYKAKLEKSMDRFFAKMELGKAVRRVNWSITTNTLLFSQGGNHLYEGGETELREEVPGETKQKPDVENQKTLDVDAPDLQESIERQKEDVVIENCRLRCERQTLHRMPKTRALVFMFKTYQYTLEDVKAEGSGPELAEAIPGLFAGTVPDMAYYKRAVVWGDKVVEYLKS